MAHGLLSSSFWAPCLLHQGAESRCASICTRRVLPPPPPDSESDLPGGPAWGTPKAPCSLQPQRPLYERAPARAPAPRGVAASVLRAGGRKAPPPAEEHPLACSPRLPGWAPPRLGAPTNTLTSSLRTSVLRPPVRPASPLSIAHPPSLSASPSPPPPPSRNLSRSPRACVCPAGAGRCESSPLAAHGGAGPSPTLPSGRDPGMGRRWRLQGAQQAPWTPPPVSILAPNQMARGRNPTPRRPLAWGYAAHVVWPRGLTLRSACSFLGEPRTGLGLCYSGQGLIPSPSPRPPPSSLESDPSFTS